MKRLSYCLNGEWDFMPLHGQKNIHSLPPVLSFEKEKVRVPSSWRGCEDDDYAIEAYDFAPMDVFEYPKSWRKVTSGVLHRTFRIPEETAGMRLFLHFEAISQQSYVYVNGVQVSHSVEAFLPQLIDITEVACRDGENDLTVLCTDFDFYDCEEKPDALTGLAGSWFGKFCRGIWQDAFLEARAPVYLEDTEVVTSVRLGKASFYADLRNTDSAPFEGEIHFCVCDGDTTVFRLTKSVRIDSGKTAVTEAERLWENPILWDTENPHLYRLTVSLCGKEGETDAVSYRFGFREFWAEGSRFFLNGIPVNLRGDSWHFQGAAQQNREYAENWYRLCRENGINSVRLHAEPHPVCYLDVADEMGILIIDETAIYGSGKSMYAGAPAYIQNCRDHIGHLIRRDKNHASVVIWSQQNEMRWVPGRDILKQYEYELMQIFHACDRSGRLVSLDGDNRLLPAEQTEVASLHYNIDGTINQWTRQTPLTIGEHGGMWYICPQNSSMYMGLDAYLHNELCMRGISIKEQLFMEYARRREVTGISSFNFAHYYAQSMPKEDVALSWEDLTTPGPKPKKIKKFSMTVNNGLLDNYPVYTPNDAYYYAKEGMRPVTVIAREYNCNFYDDLPISRGFDIYNDTLHPHHCRLDITVSDGICEIYRTSFAFLQQPAEHIVRCFTFMPPNVLRRTALTLTAALYHEDVHQFTLNRTYSVFPASLRTAPVTERPTAFYGHDADYHVIAAMIPGCVRLTSPEELTSDYELLVIGSNLREKEETLQPVLAAFLNGGGNIVLLEQFSFSFGTMTLQKTDFLRAQASDLSHPIFQGLTDDDFTFWHETVEEEGPLPFIHSAFEKPDKGDYTILLECSFGDFGDGGDLWSPLMVYDNAGSIVVANQLDIMCNLWRVPQAAVLLRNMISYAVNAPRKTRRMAGALLGNDSAARTLLENMALDYREVSPEELGELSLLIVSGEAIDSALDRIAAFAAAGKQVVILPTTPAQAASLSSLLQDDIKIIPRPVYQLSADYTQRETRSLSIVDLYGADLAMMSPREVENRVLAYHAIQAKHAVPLLSSVENTIWEDLFVRGYNGEYCKRSLPGIHAASPVAPAVYATKHSVGHGSVILCQYIADSTYDKAIRTYTRLLSNIGFTFHDGAMNCIKGAERYALPMIMSLPYRNYWGYDRAMEYFSDPEYSLNNLGEGLYGWMKKLERNPHDGYLRARESAGQDMFMTCFVHCLKHPADQRPLPEKNEYLLDLDINCPYELYLNGQRTESGRVTLRRGINRFFLLAHGANEEVAFRPVFRNPDGSFATNLRIRMTVDEIDPK